jgi:hypothetical protein
VTGLGPDPTLYRFCVYLESTASGEGLYNGAFVRGASARTFARHGVAPQRTFARHGAPRGAHAISSPPTPLLHSLRAGPKPFEDEGSFSPVLADGTINYVDWFANVSRRWRAGGQRLATLALTRAPIPPHPHLT